MLCFIYKTKIISIFLVYIMYFSTIKKPILLLFSFENHFISCKSNKNYTSLKIKYLY